MGCSRKTKCYTTVSFAGVFVILGILLLIGFPYLYNYILKSQLSLHTNSVSYNMWKETPIPMYMYVYLFNWTNPKDVVDSKWTIKPIVEELGPYTFSEHHVRVNVTWNANNTVTFQQIRTWHFLPEKSKGSLDDDVTNINVIVSTVAYIVRHKHYVIRKIVDEIFRELRQDMYITRTARELLFDGYDDTLIDILQKINTTINIPFKKFGWFVERNGSAEYDGLYNMFTGRDDLEKLGIVDRWNGNSQVPFYPGKCGKVAGTTGELWPPVPNNKTLYLFVSDMCSTAEIDYARKVELRGVEGSQYSGTNRTFDTGELYPDMACFEPGEKIPTGLRNVSSCRFGAPAFLSFPHFYLGDKSLQEAIVGLNASEEKHKLYLELEPSTGLPLNVHARAQVSILIQPIHGLKYFENVKRTFMPAMWFEQQATLTEDLTSQIKILLILPNIGLYTGIGLTTLGLFVFFVLVAIICRKDWRENEGEKLISAESSTSIVT